MPIEAIRNMEREERSGPQYQPGQAGVYKWVYQKGFLYLGDRKIAVRHPRLRGPEGEIPLKSYESLKRPGAFYAAIVLATFYEAINFDLPFIYAGTERPSIWLGRARRHLPRCAGGDRSAHRPPASPGRDPDLR
jgi:hypothetical protein